MNIRIVVSVCIVMVCRIGTAGAQDLFMERNVPIGALPALYNGGFSGEAGVVRVSNYNYVSKLPPYYSYGGRTESGTVLSVDHFVSAIRSGMAVTVGHQKHLGNNRSSTASFALSPKFSINGKLTIAPFADVSFGLKRFFNSRANRYEELRAVASEAGFLANSAKAYVGMSATVFTKGPVMNTTFPDFFYHSIKGELQAGYTWQPTPRSDWSFTPQVLIGYRRWFKGNYLSLIDLNLIGRYKRVIGGVNNNGYVLGYQANRFRVQVAYLYTNGSRAARFHLIGDNTYLNWRIFDNTSQTSNGTLSLRYVFKKSASVKMPGFS